MPWTGSPAYFAPSDVQKCVPSVPGGCESAGVSCIGIAESATAGRKA